MPFLAPVSLIARQFDEDYGGEQRLFDLLALRDGQETSGNAVPAGLDTFRRSWRRPEWQELVHNTPLSGD